MWPYRRLKCMTLVELLTALGITMLLLMISIPIFTKQAKVGNVEASARVAEGFINRARNFAFNPNREFPVSYRVDLNSADGKTIQATIYGDYYLTQDQTGVPLEEVVDQLSIAGAWVSSGAASITFKPVTGEVINSSVMPITIKSVNSDNAKQIAVNSLGNVEVTN